MQQGKHQQAKNQERVCVICWADGRVI